MRRVLFWWVLVGVCLWEVGCRLGPRSYRQATGSISVVKAPSTSVGNDFHVGNRPPLRPSPFMKLPVGAIEPKGWLRRQLELEAEGFTGHLLEISKFLVKENNAWLSAKGEGHSPWEEVPYWLRGFANLGYVLGDERIISESQQWIEAVMASQREDGYFGPRANLSRIKGKPDLWPNMIMLNVLQGYYEYRGDERVLEFMKKYFRWELTVPDEDFLEPFWQNQRASDNLASVYWLYNRTGEKFLLDLGRKIHRNTADWTSGVANWHTVNISQCFRGPAIYWQQSKDPNHLAATERDFQRVMGIYGQVPGGMFGADEYARPGYTGPRQAAETCAMVEMMLSAEMLLRFTGQAKWADRCEDVAFNSLPAAFTADLKALRYFTAPNMILCDRRSKAPGFEKPGPTLFFNPHIHRCCQHNSGHGWPYYAEHLWLAAAGNGLAAVLYAPCEVTAKVGDGTSVRIIEDTRYPFEEDIELRIRTPRAVRFPLFLRVPGWCRGAKVTVDGRVVQVGSGASRMYIQIERVWHDGDKVQLELPMEITIRKWTKNKGCVSVDRGPLTYSLKIAERYVRQGGTERWPAWEIQPATAWNYGLILDESNPAASFEVVKKSWPADEQPFEANAAPIELRARAKKIPGWREDDLGLVGRIQQSPVRSDEPVEEVTLIPMGCARLRISAFPVIGEGAGARRWAASQEPSWPAKGSKRTAGGKKQK